MLTKLPPILLLAATPALAAPPQQIHLQPSPADPTFDGFGTVDGGGATSVLLKDYPEPQRSQILDLLYKPNFGASVSALYVEIPGDGNSTQGSMPSHMHTKDDLNYSRGYIWWLLAEAKKRNPNLSLDGTAWSAPGWLGQNPATRFPQDHGDPAFFSSDTIDYYIKWLQGLRNVYHLEFDAIGCRNEKGASDDFAIAFRHALNANGFQNVKLHAFDNWPPTWSLDFVKDLPANKDLRDSIDILSSHSVQPTPDIQAIMDQLHKPYWNTEQHVYKKGFDCEISLVQAFNNNFIDLGATRVVVWYGIAGVYPMEPYSEDPAALLARSPWSGHYDIREVLWGYAHYGQFTRPGWTYLKSASGKLSAGGSFVSLKSPANDYSLILETKDAKAPQQLHITLDPSLSSADLCLWRSNEKDQFTQQPSIHPTDHQFTLTLDPNAIYSLSTTTGQQKGAFPNIPADKHFPFPYAENFDEYSNPKSLGYLPHYTADISGAFEIADRPDGPGKCLHQAVPVRTISWAPDWQPYTILGDDNWKDYTVSADVYLNPGDSAAIMGRVNNVGTGYGFIPKGYFLRLSDQGQCDLVVVRGKKDKKTPVGDAEQQALIAAGKDEGDGGEKILASAHLPAIAPNSWHKLTLQFSANHLTALIDNSQVLTATDPLYTHGMAGLLAAASTTPNHLSTPFFDNLHITPLNTPTPSPSPPLPTPAPLSQP
ncbi:MAG TPA: galactosylceramidase [Phycisphaerae bacterium]|nr:galactosylceramidase [Phycisphaerae bacterium]